MLVLTRGIGDRIVIGNDIVLTVVRIRGQRVQLGFEAPPNTPIRRGETLVGHQSELTAEVVLSHPDQDWS